MVMISVTRLNGEKLHLNWMNVEYLESIPETKIRLMNGDYYLIKDSVESVARQVEERLARCLRGQDTGEKRD